MSNTAVGYPWLRFVGDRLLGDSNDVDVALARHIPAERDRTDEVDAEELVPEDFLENLRHASPP